MHNYFATWLSTFVMIAYLVSSNANIVDYNFCRGYKPQEDGVTTDVLGRNITFMGHTWDTNYYILFADRTADFYEAANSQCAKLGLTIATIRTDCEYGVFDRWFKVNYPTNYSVWIGAVRFGDDAIWYPSKEPVDFSGFGFRYIPGPYPGYSPVPYPWINCVTASRNCQPFSSGPTNPCTQTATKPDLQFLYQDCRDKRMRIVCEEPCNMPDEYEY